MLVLMGGVLAVYARYLDADMVGTDSLVAIRGGRITSWADFAALWTSPLNATTSFAETQAVFYRPVATLVFSAEYAIWGLNAVGFHVTNAVIQALVAGLGFGMLRSFGLSHAAAFAGAALLGFHPSMAAAVPVIARRYDALSVAALFGCLMLLCRALEARGRKALLLNLASAVALAAALLCKESAFGFVPLLPLVPFVRNRHARATRSVALVVPHLVVVALVVFSIRYLVLGELGGHSGTTAGGGLDWGGYELMLGRYVGFLVWPLDMWLPSSFRGMAVLGLATAAVTVAAAASLPRPYRWLFVLGVAWVVWFGIFFTALLHMSGPWYMYYPLGGVALAGGALIDGCVARIKARQLRAIPVALALAGPTLCAAAALPVSPLVLDYKQWHTAGAVTRRVLVDAAECIGRLGPREAITFWNLPRDYLDGTRETEFLAITMLETFSMEAFIHLLRPGEEHPLYVGASVRLAGPVPDLESQCERPGGDRLRLVARGAGLPEPELPPVDAGF